MPFKKGQSGNPKGRPQGALGKRKSIFDSLEEITYDGKPVDLVQLFFKGLMTMPPYQQVDALIELMKFVYPKQSQIDIGNKDQEGFKIVIEDYKKK